MADDWKSGRFKESLGFRPWLLCGRKLNVCDALHMPEAAGICKV